MKGPETDTPLPPPSGRNGFLRDLNVFQGCSEAELRQVEALANEIEVDAGEVLIREGRGGLDSFVIVSGEAEVSLRGRRLAVLGPGALFGEMTVLAPGRPRSATVTALTSMRLLVLDPRSLAVVMNMASVARRVLTVLVERLRAAQGSPTYGEEAV